MKSSGHFMALMLWLSIIGNGMQWLIAADRILATLWNWYKFHGYGSGDPLPMHKDTQIEFLILSILLALFTIVLSKLSGYSAGQRNILVLVSISVLACAGLWGGVLLSPLIALI
jgi:hypothetical protein